MRKQRNSSQKLNPSQEVDELKKVVQYLLDNEYAVVVNGEVVITAKLNKTLKGEFKELDKPVSIIGSGRTAQELDAALFPDEKRLLWDKFIQDADIPYRVVSPNTRDVYTVRQWNKVACKKLLGIISNPKVDYNTLVESTKNYYATVSYKKTLTNYLNDDIWAQEYLEWVKNKGRTAPRNDGSNWAESL